MFVVGGFYLISPYPLSLFLLILAALLFLAYMMLCGPSCVPVFRFLLLVTLLSRATASGADVSPRVLGRCPPLAWNILYAFCLLPLTESCFCPGLHVGLLAVGS